MELLAVKTGEEIALVAALAQRIWHEHFTPIIGAAQVEYMLVHFQSQGAIETQIAQEGYLYYRMCADGQDVGYMAIRPEEDALFLSKLYLDAAYRGRGYARQAYHFLLAYCKEHRLGRIYLSCNKENEKAMRAYQALGFSIKRAVQNDIGGGFIMDDYIWELCLHDLGTADK